MSRICDIINSLDLILDQYSTHTSVMRKLEASNAQTLRMDFTVRYEQSDAPQLNFKN